MRKQFTKAGRGEKLLERERETGWQDSDVKPGKNEIVCDEGNKESTLPHEIQGSVGQ